MLAGAALAALRKRDEGGVQADVRVRYGAAHDATSTVSEHHTLYASATRASAIIDASRARSALTSQSGSALKVTPLLLGLWRWRQLTGPVVQPQVRLRALVAVLAVLDPLLKRYRTQLVGR